MQYDDKRHEEGVRAFKILSWTGGAFGITVFLFAFFTGTPITKGFIAVVGLLAGYVLLPFALRLTNKFELIVIIGMVWVVLLVGVSTWFFGGYAAAGLPWLCAIPIFAHYYLRNTGLFIVLAAMGVCFTVISYQHIAG